MKKVTIYILIMYALLMLQCRPHTISLHKNNHSNNFYHNLLISNFENFTTSPIFLLIWITNDRRHDELCLDQTSLYSLLINDKRFVSSSNLYLTLQKNTNNYFDFSGSSNFTAFDFKRYKTELSNYYHSQEYNKLLNQIEFSNIKMVDITNSEKQRLFAHLLLLKKFIVRKDSMAGNILWIKK